MASLTPQQVAQYAYNAGFRGDALTTVVAIAKRESAYETDAYNGDESTGDNSVGLMQINIIGDLLPDRGRILQDLGYNVDPYNHAQVRRLLEQPEINMQAAYAISGGGQSFGPWSGFMAITGTDIDAARNAVAKAGYDPGTISSTNFEGASQMADGDYGGGTVTDEKLEGLIQTWLDLYNNPPNRDNYDEDGKAKDGSGAYYSDDFAAWQARVDSFGNIVKAYQTAHPTKDQDSPLAIATQKFNAGMQEFEAKRELSNDAFAQSQANASRSLEGKAESRARAEDVLQAQQFLSQWGAPEGKTSWTRGELGMLPVQGISQDAPFLTYSGQTYINPSQVMAGNDAALGVMGEIPPIQGSAVSRADIPSWGYSAPRITGGGGGSTGSGAAGGASSSFNFGTPTEIAPALDVLPQDTPWYALPDANGNSAFK